MNRSEEIAKIVIETLVEGSRMHYHDDQSRGHYDFDLEYPDGAVAAVEVTVSTNEQLEHTSAAILDSRKGGTFVAAKKTRNGWWVHPMPGANINKIREQVDEYLAAIESEGLLRFFSYTDASSFPSVARILYDLRIEGGSVIKWKTPNCIRIGLPTVGGLVSGERVQQAVEAEANKEDNRRKLGSCGCDKRHLFVYIDHRNFLAWVALVDEQPPQLAPSLPIEITNIWVATHTRSANEIVVWKAERGEKWQNLGVLAVPSPTNEDG
jgi:hypothetical protein